MATRYEYKCDACGHDYVEQRNESDSQFFTTCNDCGSEKYKLTNETEITDA